jgi:photosystem II stability/assembly factor-like uncharacterized protein
LYKTVDGGKTWKKVSISIPKETDIVFFSFINPLTGWVLLNKKNIDILSPHENHFWILHTNDGGVTWITQYDGGGTTVSRVSFQSEKEGWIVGHKYIGIAPLRFDLFVLHTIDQGQNWFNVSDSLNVVAREGKESANDSLTNIITENPLASQVLTLRGRIYKTNNGGQSWSLGGVLNHEPEQTCICNFGTQDNKRFWIGGGADSVEGMWGMLAFENDDKKWQRYRLGGIRFSDIKFLSENQIFACGAVALKDSKNASLGKNEGVVLFSSDKGQHWSIIYQSKQTSMIHMLAVITPDNLLAVGNNGVVLNLRKNR